MQEKFLLGARPTNLFTDHGALHSVQMRLERLQDGRNGVVDCCIKAYHHATTKAKKKKTEKPRKKTKKEEKRKERKKNKDSGISKSTEAVMRKKD